MKIGKQARRDGKSLFRASLVEGRLDEGRAREIVKRVIAGKPRRYLPILAHFQRLLKIYLDGRRARVENAVESTPELVAAARAALERRYGPGLDIDFQTNPALLGGLRIRVGSDVYDGSIQARFEELKTRL